MNSSFDPSYVAHSNPSYYGVPSSSPTGPPPPYSLIPYSPTPYFPTPYPPTPSHYSTCNTFHNQHPGPIPYTASIQNSYQYQCFVPTQPYLPINQAATTTASSLKIEAFHPAARFDIASRSIPPPPPGVEPNEAQLAVLRGQSVLVTQKKQNKLFGGKGAGYTFW